MKGPEQFGDGYREELGPQDTSDFDKLYKGEYRSVNEERAKESFKRSFEANIESEYLLFRNVVNAFSSPQAGFTTTIVNPLYEFGSKKPDVLLAKFQTESVHLCFVTCEVGGHNYESWISDVNRMYDVASDDDVIDQIKESILCADLSIGSIQYVTLTRAKDLPDVDVDILNTGASPDYYALWKLLRNEEYNESTGEMEEAKTIHYENGSMSVPEFKNVCNGGIDLLGADNDDIRFSLTSHPVFVLGEICLNIYLNPGPEQENPKEFFKSEFEQNYLDNIHFGDNRDAMDPISESKIDELLEFGIEHGIIKKDESVVDEKDYKIMWGSEKAADIKEMVRRKFIDSKIPEETGRIAFSRAKEQFSEGEYTLDDFDYDDS